MTKDFFARIEWPTIALVVATYAIWFAFALAGEGLNPLLWIAGVAIATVLYWSLVHEIVHGHPTQNTLLNHALVYVPIGWVYALGRFRDGHLQHHATGELTDPFDDPESWYLAQRDWKDLPSPIRMLMTVNNTLAGRLTVGPAITIWRMIAGDLSLMLKPGAASRSRRGSVALAWAIHVPGVVLLVLALSHWSTVPAWQYFAAAYCGVAILLIRTFLEHQASGDAEERTVIIEDRGPLAFLFLFNNFHVVHHTRPCLAWYRIPGFYRRHRANFIRRNNGYVYRSYADIFRLYFFKPKEPVAHPFVA
ncbi:MAG: fatty acid desaturase [Nitratireductor sp.]|nr:fatty acid desaturase [Nitratireductor sp.]